jgi:hypothetical protein
LANIYQSLRKMKKIIFLIIIGTFLSCSEDYYDNSELNNSEFESYLNSFLEEGIIRGYDYTNKTINFYFADIKGPDTNTVGLCYSGNKEIFIDREYWNNAREKDKERLIFHELGHCFLKRNHKNEKNINGECLSYMRGKFDCSSNLYSSLWRKYYLDELFDQNTELPEWYTISQEYEINYNNILEIISIVDLNTDYYGTSIDLNTKEKIVIEFTFKNWKESVNNRNAVLTDIVFGGYFFGSAPLSEKGRIYILGELGGYFENNDYEFKENIKLTIRKKNKLVQFFVDERFIHAMEIESFNNNIVKASFDEPIDMDIKIFEYN